MSRRAPIARAATALQLPGIDADAPIASTTATPANDARAIRRAKAIMADFGPSLRAAMEPALRPLARLTGDESAELDTTEEAAALDALTLRTDLACTVAQGVSGWELRVARTLWEGEAIVRVVFSCGAGESASVGETSLVCRSAEDLARRVTGWMARFDGPVRVAQAHAIDVMVDGAAVVSLRWVDGAWSADDAAYRAQLDAALATAREASTDTARAEEIDTAHAHALQRENAAGISGRAFEEPRESSAVKLEEQPEARTVVKEAPDARGTTTKTRALRVVPKSTAEAPSEPRKTAAGGAARAPRERKAARSPSRGARP